MARILVIEDDLTEQSLLRHFLTYRGHSVFFLAGSERPEKLAGTRADLIILGGVAEPTDPEALAAGIRKKTPGLPMLALGKAGAADLTLPRPVDFAALDKALQNLLKPAPEPERKKRVLAVDDDPDQLHFMRSVFERRGVEFVGVQDPVKMLEAPPQGRFDVILLDVMMPGVDGLELCRRFRADPTTADTHIVMVTAEGDAAMIKVAEKFGADGYLQKPVRPADLLGLIGLRPAAPPPPNIAAGAPSPTVQAGPIRQPSGSGRPRVLVVDDDRDILNFVAQVFGRAGIAVHAVSDAKEIKNDVPQGGYDLILMDVFMPGVTGIELLRDIVRDVRNLTAKMVVITAHDDPQLRALAQKAGADQYLVKPLAPRQLLGLLEELPFAPEA